MTSGKKYPLPGVVVVADDVDVPVVPIVVVVGSPVIAGWKLND